ITMSFKGVFDHKPRADKQYKGDQVLWDNDMLPWHLGRPFTGTIVGIAVFIVLQAVYPNGNPSPITLAAASFVLGTQEAKFFDFTKQIGAVVTSVPTSATRTDRPPPDKRQEQEHQEQQQQQQKGKQAAE